MPSIQVPLHPGKKEARLGKQLAAASSFDPRMADFWPRRQQI